MGLLGRLFGRGARSSVQHPPAGLEPCSADELRTALLRLNRPERPWAVREGDPEDADLVAEWTLTDRGGRPTTTRTFTLRMRLVPDEHLVRVSEEQWEADLVGNPPRARAGYRWGRGPARSVSREWTLERGPDGRRRLKRTFEFDSAELQEPVQRTVLQRGWAWHTILSRNF